MDLQQLLTIPILSKAKVIAGHRGLDRLVQSINIMDAPDIVQFLKPGDMLLTNGYILKDRPDAHLGFITDMHAIGCAALAVKTQRFSLELSPQLLETADRLGFPIIELSEIDNTLGEIFQQSISAILQNKTHELHYALSIHKQFSTMIMQGKGIPNIVDTLSQLLSSPVLLLGSKKQITASSHYAEQMDDHSLAAPLLTFIDEHASFHTTISICLLTAEKYRHAEFHPIFTDRHEGYLIARYDSSASSKLSTLALEQAVNVIGLELTKKQAVKERSRRYKNEYFSDLIQGFIRSEQEALHRGKKYGLHAKGSSVLIIAKKDESLAGIPKQNAAPSEERFISERDANYELIKQEFTKLDLSFVMFTKNDQFGILVFLNESSWDEHTVTQQLERIASNLYTESQLSLSFGIGNPYTNVLDIGLSYKEAVKALQSGYQMRKTRFAHSYQTMDISRLLRMIPHDEMLQFHQETFKPFEGRDPNERSELMKTLSSFYENHCQIVDTAKELFVHRNTVIYRLEKCEKLTGRNIKDPMESLRFRLAFALESLLKLNPPPSEVNHTS
ncbi:PucR family transcriptional regulator ligand-binding domain-containing protein [Paenibacillus sp. FSL R5-0517]|uniref:PucR family transcriptional regulator n=1 Tax=Paenibacillus sp. FSL R5-0517 TaxID=2921647 RepID=UPI0030D77EA6